VTELARARGDAISCPYSEQALARWPANSPVLSCSLPLGSRQQDALAFCKGPLPEGEALRAMAEQAGLATHQTFELLARFGRDVAGALVISDGEPEERRYGVEPLDPAGLEQAVEELDDHPLGAHDDSELSLAGLQDKLLPLAKALDKRGASAGGLGASDRSRLQSLTAPGRRSSPPRPLRLRRRAGLLPGRMLG
jgi:serine/threonine-protein kinase HipA